MAKVRPYTVYASVYHIGPPNRTIKTSYLLILDNKGRLVANWGGGTVGEYGGRYTKKAAQLAVVRRVNGLGGTDLDLDDVKIISDEEAKKLHDESRFGGFQVFAFVENVPSERVLYLKGLYRLEFGNRAWKLSDSLFMVRTAGEKSDDELKRILAKYLNSKYDYWVEPEEIHFIAEWQKEKFEALTA